MPITYRSLEPFGHPDYRAGTDGSVYGRRGGTWRKLKPSYTRPPTVALYGPNGRKVYPVRRLILMTFVGPCPPGMEASKIGPTDALKDLAWIPWSSHQAKIPDGWVGRKEACKILGVSLRIIKGLEQKQLLRPELHRGAWIYRRAELGEVIIPGKTVPRGTITTKEIAKRLGVTKVRVLQKAKEKGWKVAGKHYHNHGLLFYINQVFSTVKPSRK